MSFDLDNESREEYNSRLLEDIRKYLAYIAAILADSTDTSIEIDDIEDEL